MSTQTLIKNYSSKTPKLFLVHPLPPSTIAAPQFYALFGETTPISIYYDPSNCYFSLKCQPTCSIAPTVKNSRAGHVRTYTSEYFYKIQGDIKIKIDQIIVKLMTNISNSFLPLLWRLELVLSPLIILIGWQNNAIT